MIHVAVLIQPYLDLLVSGEKTIECRLTRDNRAPYEAIEPGERIYFKQSAGPYRAVGTAGHAVFESNLTPKRIREIRRDYNHAIRGEAAFWKRKRNARFATLIWLEDVEAIDHGPAIPNLQGRAWLSLAEETAWRLRKPARRRRGARDGAQAGNDGRLFTQTAAVSASGPFEIVITPGNVRNGTLYVTGVIDRFPESALGGRTKDEPGEPITLRLHGGPTVETDIVEARNLLRTRIWRSWFREHSAQPGDRVVFAPETDGSFAVGLVRGAG